MTKEKRPPASNYRKPPVEHQFKKNQSGNPQGRPKKKTPPNFGALGGGITDRFTMMVWEEATRLVTVREGGKESKIPAMQALVRTMYRSIAQGNTKAAGQLLPVVRLTERERTDAALQALEYAVRYKEENSEILEQYERAGRDPPEIYPHPDDFIIDEVNGTFVIDGPITKDQAGARKALREQALGSLVRYVDVEAALQKNPTDRKLKRELKELKKYKDFLENDAARDARHKALQIARRALRKPESEATLSEEALSQEAPSEEEASDQ